MVRFRHRRSPFHSLAIVAFGIGLATATPATAQEKWAFGSSSSGSGPYVSATIVANHINAAQDVIELSAQTTGGYNENLALVASGRIAVAMGSATTIDDAYLGRNKYEGVAGAELFKNLRIVCIGPSSVIHMLVRADSSIKTFDDIRGHRINLNAPSTATRGFNELLLKAAGVGLDEIKVFSISTGKHFDALKDRVIDAGFHGYPLGLSKLLELNATTPVRLLSLPEGAFERLNADVGGVLSPYTVPANTYQGQTEPAQTILASGVYIVHKDADEDLVYTFAKALWESREAIKKEESGFKPLDASNVRFKGQTPTHPGALRFFAEAGIN